MVIMLLAFLLAVFALPCIIMPEQVWKALNVGDEAYEGGWNDINLVALSAYLVSLPRSPSLVLPSCVVRCFRARASSNYSTRT